MDPGFPVGGDDLIGRGEDVDSDKVVFRTKTYAKTKELGLVREGVLLH